MSLLLWDLGRLSASPNARASDLEEYRRREFPGEAPPAALAQPDPPVTRTERRGLRWFRGRSPGTPGLGAPPLPNRSP